MNRFNFMPQKKLTLAIVIPAFNEEGYLHHCLESVAAQTEPADEVIVVDNNSTDATAVVAKSFRFVKLLRETRQGVVFARNRGFNSTTSDIIARIDADSRLPVDWVKRVKCEFKTSSLAAVTGPVCGYDLPLPALSWLPHHLLCLILKFVPPKHPFLFGFNMAVRREAWQAISKKTHHSRQFHEDIDLAIHLHQSGFKLAYTKDLLSAASGRRYSDRPSAFAKYMSTYCQTYTRHGYRDWAVYLTALIYWAGYVFYLPWATRRLPRQHPM